MKTTVRVLSALLFFTMSLSLFAQEKTVPKEILGAWNFVMEDPQSGDSHKGVCTITEKGSETKAFFKIGDGEGSETTPFRANDNGKFYCDMEIQGYGFDVCFDLKGEALNCELDISGFVIPLEMTKAN